MKGMVAFMKGANWWERALGVFLIWQIAFGVVSLASRLSREIPELMRLDPPLDATGYATYFGLQMLNLLLLAISILAMRSVMGGRYPWLGGLYMFIWAQVTTLLLLFRTAAESRSMPEVHQYEFSVYPEDVVWLLLPIVLALVVIFQRWKDWKRTNVNVSSVQ